MPPRTRKQHEEGEQGTVSFAEVIGSLTGKEPPEIDLSKGEGDAFNLPEIEGEKANSELARLGEKIDGQMNALVQFLVNRDQHYEQAWSSVLSRFFPEQPQEDNPERPRVQRRRSLDDMQFALKRLMQPEPRPADDDSPQVLQDAINETIALRQLVMDLTQASMNMHQHGLTAVRDMTAR